jgi:DNA-binding Lrp family transcriptional regulator
MHVLCGVRHGDERPVSELRRRARGARGVRLMVTAFILMEVERPRLRSIADDLLLIEGITEVYSVAGPYDLIAIARVKRQEELSDLVTEHVAALDGIVNTETLIAFRAFSKKDLGLLWDVGS